MNQARIHQRTAVSLLPRHRVATEVGYRESRCSDLSSGGMFIESPAPAEPGTFVKVECRGDCGIFQALGKVAWRRDADSNGPAGMGVSFLTMSPGGREVLEGLVASARLSAVARADIEDERTSQAFLMAAAFATLLGMFSILLASL